ncbi:unnamed protein product [Discula destructiva]
MSATTTDNPVATTLHRAAQPSHLQDYNVRLTSDESTSPSPTPSTTTVQASPSVTVSNPPGWDDQHRGVPPYRPINRDLDPIQRPFGGSPVGDAFVFTMFTGVSILSVSCTSHPRFITRLG